ncbi:MAG: hypothetical protein JW724_04065 [Candidatus Altiarchaeota archaeon]|nr:hypothetical protein [Candidatus Altiarchaeota archaeon]
MKSRNESVWGLYCTETDEPWIGTPSKENKRTKRIFYIALAAVLSTALYSAALIHAFDTEGKFNKAIGAAIRVPQEDLNGNLDVKPFIIALIFLATAASITRIIVSDAGSERGTQES